jgi:hypothetical protein
MLRNFILVLPTLSPSDKIPLLLSSNDSSSAISCGNCRVQAKTLNICGRVKKCKSMAFLSVDAHTTVPEHILSCFTTYERASY